MDCKDLCSTNTNCSFVDFFFLCKNYGFKGKEGIKKSPLLRAEQLVEGTS